MALKRYSAFNKRYSAKPLKVPDSEKQRKSRKKNSLSAKPSKAHTRLEGLKIVKLTPLDLEFLRC